MDSTYQTNDEAGEHVQEVDIELKATQRLFEFLAQYPYRQSLHKCCKRGQTAQAHGLKHIALDAAKTQ